MGKHVIYVKERYERDFEAEGVDLGKWIRGVVKAALEERALAARTDVPPRTVVRETRSSSAGAGLPATSPALDDEAKTDFKPGFKK